MRSSHFASFDAYVVQYPEAEHYREWLTREGREGVAILRGSGTHQGLPGGYIWACVVHRRSWGDYPESWAVFLNDNDDGCCDREFPTEQEARAEFHRLLDLDFVSMHRLVRDDGYSF